ncbi:MAG TPA: hypothetical protein VGH54_26540 [Mycobacterium sp.]|uniref:hypothetical protein n=1 Tax=Mycobacterium sp. TaxID=1785 RepID=UPI002F42214B
MPSNTTPSSRKHEDARPHNHGSKYQYDLGCGNVLCRAAAAAAKARVRTKHRAERELVDGRWIHPKLAPSDSDKPARHGTMYAVRDFSCECVDCQPNLRRLASMGGLLAPAAWHLNDRLFGAVVFAVLTFMLWRGHYGQIASHPAVRRTALLLVDACTGVLIVTFASLIVAALVAHLRPYQGRHRA